MCEIVSPVHLLFLLCFQIGLLFFGVIEVSLGWQPLCNYSYNIDTNSYWEFSSKVATRIINGVGLG